jgi:hypothetical protein
MAMTLQVGDRITTRLLAHDSPVCIYHLLDPRDESVRYVGSTNDPHKRYAAHISDATKTSYGGFRSTSKKDVWIRELALIGLEPVLVVVNICDRGDAVASEVAEHQRQVGRGVSLLNRVTPCRNAIYSQLAASDAS